MKKQSGFTLIEIMIALLLGLIVLSATIGIYVSTVKGSTDTINSARLNHDLDSVMSLMVHDIRRAGYWGGAIAGADNAANPFSSETTNITNIQLRNLAAPATALAAGAAGNCILYTYDADGDGVIDADEYYGFRLNGSTINMRLTGTAAVPASCTNGDWEENIAGDQITITKLEFFTTAYQCLNLSIPTGPGDLRVASQNMPCDNVTAANLAVGEKAVESRQITINLTGRLVDDTSVTKTLSNTVKVRNDRVCIEGDATRDC